MGDRNSGEPGVYSHLSFFNRLAVVAVVALVCYGVYYTIGKDNRRESVERARSLHNLHQIAYAMHQYHAEFGSLPPAVIFDQDREPLHSWRILLLPSMSYHVLYAGCNLNEPWSSARNTKWLDTWTVPQYQVPKDSAGGNARIVAVTGDGSAFPYDHCTSFEDFSDGLNNVVILAIVKLPQSKWYAPVDLLIEDLNALRVSILAVAFADVHVHWLRENLTADALRAACTIAGGERTEVSELVAY